MKTMIVLYFILMITIESKKGSSCGSYIPKDSSSCFGYTTDDQLCCYLTSFDNFYYSNLCYPINRTEYLALNDKIQMNGFTFSVDCGVTIGTTCSSIDTPRSYLDCSQFSSSTNTCCFYKHKDDTSCVWKEDAGKGYINSDGIELICGCEIVKILPYFLFIIILFIF